MSVDGRVNSHGNVVNGGQVRGGGGNEMDIEQSSVNGALDGRQKFEDKGLEQHDVSEGNNFSTTKRKHNVALGNESDSGEPDNKRRCRNVPNGSSRDDVEKPLNQQSWVFHQMSLVLQYVMLFYQKKISKDFPRLFMHFITKSHIMQEVLLE